MKLSILATAKGAGGKQLFRMCTTGLPHIDLGFYFILWGWPGKLEPERLNYSSPSLLRCLLCSRSLYKSSLERFFHRLNSIICKHITTTTTMTKIKHMQEKTKTNTFKPQGHQVLKSLLIVYQIKKERICIQKSDQSVKVYKK